MIKKTTKQNNVQNSEGKKNPQVLEQIECSEPTFDGKNSVSHQP